MVSPVFPVVHGEEGWAAVRRGTAIFLTFKGSLHGEVGMKSAKRCIELMDGDPICLLCDLFDLNSYESRVRTDWQRIISPVSDQFTCFYGGATNPLVRMGVTAFGLFAGISTKVFATTEELQQALVTKLAAQ